MQPHPFDTPPWANFCASTAAEILLCISNTSPQKIHLKAIYYFCVFFSPFLFGSGLPFDVFLHHKMCPSQQQKLENSNKVIHAICLIIIIEVSQREPPSVNCTVQAVSKCSKYFPYFFCYMQIQSLLAIYENNRFSKNVYSWCLLFAHVFYNAGDITLPKLIFSHLCVHWNFMHI